MREGVLVLKPRIRKGKGSRSKAVASIRRSESAMSMASTTSADSADSADSEASGESSDSAQQRRRRRQRRVHEHAEDSDEEDEDEEGDEGDGVHGDGKRSEACELFSIILNRIRFREHGSRSRPE